MRGVIDDPTLEWDACRSMRLAGLVHAWAPICALLLAACASDDGEDAAKDAGRDVRADQMSGCANVPSACVSEFCSLRKCGGESIYDEQGCARPQCTRESDCAAGEKCRGASFNSVNCAEQASGNCECTFGLSMNLASFCFPANAVTPCPECSSAALTCTTPGWHEAAEFRWTSFTASSCSGLGVMVAGKISLHCDTKKLCNSNDCEDYTFDGSVVTTPSGVKCKLTQAPP